MKFAARFRMVLLATTGLVIAGCNSIPNQAASADPATDNTPIATANDSDKNTSPDGGLSENQMMRIAARTWNKGDAVTAMGLYATAAKENPKSPEPLLRIAEIMRKTGRPQDAISVYRKALVISPSNRDALNGIGYSQLQQGKPYLATQAFASALTVDGKNSTALSGMGVAYDKAGEHAKAQSYYRKAIKMSPDNLNYQSNLALSLALTGDVDQAIAILKVVTKNPHATAKHRQNLALVYGMAGQSAEAMKYSRMDLSVQDARNNALYFRALNEEPSQETAMLDDQFKIMKASKNEIEVARNSTDDEPRMPVNPDVVHARQGTEHLGTDARKKAPVPAIRPPQYLTPAPKAPMTVASAEKPVAKASKDAVPLIKADRTPVKSAPATKAPTVLTKAEPVAKPATPDMKVAKAVKKPEEKTMTVAKAPKKLEEKAMTVASAADKPKADASEFREWKVEKKESPIIADIKPVELPKQKEAVASLPAEKAAPAPMAKAAPVKSEPVKTASAEPAKALPVTFGGPVPEVTPMAEKAVIYRPDGGKYFLQIGSYKDKAQAEKGWKILQTANKDILEGIDPVINTVDLGADKGGTFYRLQIGGFGDKKRTMQLCGTLRDRSYGCFMAMPAKSVKPSPSDMVGPGQQMADKAAPIKDGAKTPAAKPSDTHLIADFKKGFDAL